VAIAIRATTWPAHEVEARRGGGEEAWEEAWEEEEEILLLRA
jgi:hypothetical protein